MNRYLLNISYIGTRLRGIQKITNKSACDAIDLTSVQGLIEIALKKLNPINNFSLVLSSRTDSGVHALNSTVHVDLESSYSLPFNPNRITHDLNRVFHYNNWDIRILRTLLISDDFHCRYNAKSRTYLYRVAVRKTSAPGQTASGAHFVNYIPIEDTGRCLYIQNTIFIEEKAQLAVSLLRGKHDFNTFMGNGDREKVRERPSFTLRKIDDFTLTKGVSNVTSFHLNKCNEIYDYWEFRVSGKSFLNRQVRRMVGAILAVAQEKITLKDFYEMLTIPSPRSWNSKAVVVEPYGLYLCDVEYDPNELRKAVNSKLEDIRKSIGSDHEFFRRLAHENL